MTEPVVIGNATLYLGDCLEILPTLGKVDAVVTDPPYAGLAGGYEYANRGVTGPTKQSVSVGDPWKADYAAWLPIAESLATYGLIYFTTYHALAETLGIVTAQVAGIGVWHKPNAHPGPPSTPNLSCEFFVMVRTGPGKRWGSVSDHISYPQDFGGCVSRGERVRNADGSNAHPTQKPVEVMKQLIPDWAETILDPFMGSGTTGVACAKLGRKFIGIEIEPKYFDIACKRIEQAYAQPDMFIRQAPAAKQEKMF